MSYDVRRDAEAEMQAGVDAFDREFYRMWGRYPDESPLAGGPPPPPEPTATAKPISSRRREAVQALIDRGATEGEREAARQAMYRLEHPSEQAHAATERGSYYARDTVGGNDE